MDQLKGSIVNVVLTIQEGKGLEALKGFALILATFNGMSLESDLVPGGEDSLFFDTNLEWVVEKKTLRKMRSGNIPLRVDCFSTDGKTKRDKFGHVLLDLRTAQIVQSTQQMLTYSWYKVLGVRTKKRNVVPELYMALSLTAHGLKESTPKEDTSQCLLPVIDELASPIPVQYLEDGFIKVGEEESDAFSLIILIKSASNLDMLLPEVLVFNQTKNIYCVCMKIFGIPIKTKQFSKELHRTIVFDERIVVRLLSDLEILFAFFEDQTVELGFYCGRDLLGITHVPFNRLQNLNECLVLDNCSFKFPSPNGIVPVCGSGRKPTISIEISLLKITNLCKEDNTLASGDHNPIVSSSSNVTTSITNVNDAETDGEREAKEEMTKQRELLEEEICAFNDWKEEEIQNLKAANKAELQKAHEELELKKLELDGNVNRCKELQVELQEKLEELRTEKLLRKSRKSSKTSLMSTSKENQIKFGDCEKDLLINYITKLQHDNGELRNLLAQQKQEIDGIKKTALTKEQTANLLQELKGLEEKFEVAQQNKVYFKEQWKRACEEIHELKNEEYKLLQDQIRERKEELRKFRAVNAIAAEAAEQEEE